MKKSFRRAGSRWAGLRWCVGLSVTSGLLSMLGAVGSSLVSAEALAQEPIVRPTRLPTFGRSIVGTDDTTALEQNPANLAFLPGSELRWAGLYLNEDVGVPWQGHAFSYGFRLPFLGMATGFRADFVDPPDDVASLSDENYQWLTWGLALRLTETVALGSSLQWSYSDGPFADDLTSYSVGLTTRPFNGLGFSFVGHDLNAPTNLSGGGLNASFDVAAAIRPLGTRALEIGLEGKYIEGLDVWVPRGSVGVDVPYVGRVIGDFRMSDPGDEATRAWIASLALSVYGNTMAGSSELGGGVVTGNGLGVDDSYNVQSSVALRGWREPVGVAPMRYALRVRIEQTLNPRQHVALLRGLWSVARESSIDAVVFELRESPSDSLAHIQELRDAVFHLRRAGKRVMCHLEDASGAELYFCSAANQIHLNPAGGLRFAGLRTQYTYLGGLLGKLGIKADFIRIGAHKSAPERFTRTGSSKVARDDKIDLLQQFERNFTEGVAVGRNLDFKAVRDSIAKGPFVAQEAKDAKFVDSLVFDDQLQDLTNKLVGRKTPLLNDRRTRIAPEHFGRRQAIAVVYVEGDMVDGRSKTIPLLGMQTSGSYTIAETLKAVREDPRFAAVILRVESPGGSSMAADVIWREVALTKKVKPMIVSMGAAAASGGYYISAPATRIFANPLTITGSIGIFYGKADVSELMRRIGVGVEVYKTAPRADAESFFRPFSKEERVELERKVQQFYDVFLKRVADGRSMTKEAVDKLGQGRVWTGEQAKENGLIDELGGLRQALDYAREKTGLDETAPIFEFPVQEQSFLSKILGVPGLSSELSAEAVASLPPQLKQLLVTMAPFLIHPTDRPLARMDLTMSPTH